LGLPLEIRKSTHAPACDPGLEPASGVLGEDGRGKGEHRPLRPGQTTTPQQRPEELVDAGRDPYAVPVVVHQPGGIRREQLLGAVQVHDDLAASGAHGAQVRLAVNTTTTSTSAARPEW
jgi:hypothetical protein